MFENVNMNGVFQSIVDTWLPVIGVVAAVIIVIIVVSVIRKRKNTENNLILSVKCSCCFKNLYCKGKYIFVSKPPIVWWEVFMNVAIQILICRADGFVC